MSGQQRPKAGARVRSVWSAPVTIFYAVASDESRVVVHHVIVGGRNLEAFFGPGPYPAVTSSADASACISAQTELACCGMPRLSSLGLCKWCARLDLNPYSVVISGIVCCRSSPSYKLLGLSMLDEGTSCNTLYRLMMALMCTECVPFHRC
jgi:hypothetical protein